MLARFVYDESDFDVMHATAVRAVMKKLCRDGRAELFP